VKTLAERFKFARENADMSQDDLAAKIGVTQQSIAKIESGITLQPRKIKELAQCLGVSQQWLQLGIEENAELSSYVVQESEGSILDPGLFVNIPILDIELSAGNGSEAELIESSLETFPMRRSELRKAGVGASNVKIVKIWGSSLVPVLTNGDYVAVDTAQLQSIRDGDLYAIRDGVLLRVKILIGLPDGGLILRSFNKDEYPDEILTYNERRARVHMIGRVFWSSRSW